jgi:hypothetical protein
MSPREPSRGVFRRGRPWLSLWPFWLPPVLTLACVGFFLFLPEVEWLARFVFVVLVGLFFVALPYWWLGRLLGEALDFHTVAAPGVVLHYSPQIRDPQQVALLLERCQAGREELTQRFGFRLRRRVAVFLFATTADAAKVMGRPFYGLAFGMAHVVFLAADDPLLPETTRHELVHVFAARWKPRTVALLQEGLAMWLQETSVGRPIDVAALEFLNNRELTLSRLLQDRFFLAEPQRHSCYVLAGSFTGFLIRRHGWAAYRKLYRGATLSFRRQFRKHLGMTLEQAEQQWREGLRLRAAVRSHVEND